MEHLNQFNESEIDFIIKNGIVLFENSKKYFKTNILNLGEYSTTNFELEIQEKNKL